jgi:PIN domain nuclease of toxin-antitoxin system
MTFIQPIKPFIASQLSANRMRLLPIEMDEIETISRMPLHHKDPFDRLLIAQSFVYGMPIISSDQKFDAYGVNRIW